MGIKTKPIMVPADSAEDMSAYWATYRFLSQSQIYTVASAPARTGLTFNADIYIYFGILLTKLPRENKKLL